MPEAGKLQQNHTPVILLVDDEPGIREGIADLIRMHSYEVYTAENGEKALQVMKEAVPDLIVSDIMMPTMDGYAFYSAVRDNPSWTTIPFIFLTARSQKADIERGNILGVDDYIIKPFQPEVLLSAITGQLKRIHSITSVVEADVERMKHYLIHLFNHELRTPLTYIYGYINLLQEQMKEYNVDEETGRMLDGIQEGADRLVKLVNDLTLLIRIDSGVVKNEISTHRDFFTMAYIIRNITTNMAAFARDHHVELIADIPDDLEISCYEVYFSDAITRIVENAIKFSKNEGGKVTIRAYEDREVVTIEIEDQGIGVAKEQLKNIFERFEQINRDRYEQQGLGLGLTIARDLILLHDGKLDVQSDLGQGTTFILNMVNHKYLPFA